MTVNSFPNNRLSQEGKGANLGNDPRIKRRDKIRIGELQFEILDNKIFDCLQRFVPTICFRSIALLF